MSNEYEEFYRIGREISMNQNEGERPKPRPCLRCDRIYNESTKTNRICPDCRGKQVNTPPILERAKINYKGLRNYLEGE